jgi:hypothetical protein
VSGNGKTIFQGVVATHKHIYNRGARDLWPPEFQEVSPDSLGTIAAAQRELSRQAAKALLEPFDAGTQDGKSARARLLSCACRPAAAWLDTLPLTRALELKSGEVRTGLRHRLEAKSLIRCNSGYARGRVWYGWGLPKSRKAKEEKKQIDTNYTRKGIGHCRQPAGQVKCVRREGK